MMVDWSGPSIGFGLKKKAMMVVGVIIALVGICISMATGINTTNKMLP
jgi:hypothetical protein